MVFRGRAGRQCRWRELGLLRPKGETGTAASEARLLRLQVEL